jgi:hypothetical protein
MLSKLWTISVLLEPMLLFVLKEGTGIGSNISRVLQFVVLLGFILNFLTKPNFCLDLTPKYLWRPYLILIGYILVVTVFSFLVGGYGGQVSATQSSGLDAVFKSNATRPVVEVVVLLFQFFYFIFLAPLFLKRRRDFDFFFKCAFALLFFHFTLGWIDFLLSLNGFYWIPRHLADGRTVGQRFHGIAGEPRDAAIYMMSLLFFIAIYSLYKNGKVERPGWSVVFLITASSFATVSASFMVALVISAALLFFYFMPRMSFVRLASFTVALFVVGLGVIYAIEHQARINAYYSVYAECLFDLYQNPYQELPDLIKVSFNNVYPVIRLIREAADLNPFPLLFGSGLGSSGVANSMVYGSFQNPNNQIVRIIYEYGMIGFWIFIFVYLEILKRCSMGLNKGERDVLIITALIMLGGVFAHRTAVWLIWMGLLCAVTMYRQKQSVLIKPFQSQSS